MEIRKRAAKEQLGRRRGNEENTVVRKVGEERG